MTLLKEGDYFQLDIFFYEAELGCVYVYLQS